MGRWDYGQETLVNLARNTGDRGEELAGLVKALIVAAEPLSGRFNGAGKAAFDNFKARSDQIIADLKGGLDRVNVGQVGMEQAFATGDQSMADEAGRAMSTADFDAAKFRTA
ncbi:hypothetical protein SAMN04489712_10131 [Thermomonospora echinospora]|uniref:Uncharacterized protein n=1 Tax=Thermomonospora echinospora TaxID=1992 RepID=A0A1H5S2K0_9ACTN|nr:hypothetical protein [Thermomonospora echinospora]SEF44128.1 hypothetical protein SAMN04489712_10131 [Thermomonospora echinospora]